MEQWDQMAVYQRQKYSILCWSFVLQFCKKKETNMFYAEMIKVSLNSWAFLIHFKVFIVKKKE